jgi:hypothetical protein
MVWNYDLSKNHLDWNYVVFSYPVTFMWSWNMDIETKSYKKTAYMKVMRQQDTVYKPIEEIVF